MTLRSESYSIERVQMHKYLSNLGDKWITFSSLYMTLLRPIISLG